MDNYIEIKGARIHNLKNVDVRIPKNKLTVITGVSGSGKSSLAFDTLYEEGKRRYLLFSGTQFMVDAAPSFDKINGLSPTIAVEQRIIRQSNPRSTVGTRTKISNMLAAFFAAYGLRDQEFDDGHPLTMEMFQKNSPKGMCIRCLGVGSYKDFDEERFFEDGSLRIDELCYGLAKRGSTRRHMDNFCRTHGITIDQRLETLSDEQLMMLKYGDGGQSSFIGFVPWIHQIIQGVFSSSGRLAYLLNEDGYLKQGACPRCKGTGLGEQATHTRIGSKTITELEAMYIKDLLDFIYPIEAIKPSPLLHEIIVKLECMVDVGLQHLSLSRTVPTLSGGEIQRLFLASYIIAEMDSLIFIFDEPTIGLHEVEKIKLISIIEKLIKRGNTVIAVEHDENFIRRADYIIDLGPLAGVGGGRRIFQGSIDEFIMCEESKTAPYLSTMKAFPVKRSYKPVNQDRMLTIVNASIHNLKNITVNIPLGLMVGIAGVSGSGKSSLITDTLVPKLKELLKSKCISEDEEGTEQGEDINNECILHGTGNIKRCLIIDQKPIGRSRTSCPATYTQMFDRIRDLFAATEDAVKNGYTAGLFTVNSKGGCKLCKGDGVIHYHVGFGNFIDIDCEACGGSGFVAEAMEVTMNGMNIKDILELTVDEAYIFFKGKDKKIETILKTLIRTGMGYIKLGQKTPTISGGESQRIKLAKELSKGHSARNSLYILDEPTTGLSFHDSERLMLLLQELVEGGNSVIVTEHDPYILSNCDYIIELGPGGGRDGGILVAEGTPSELKCDVNSIIGGYLK